MDLKNRYPHLLFKRNWAITAKTENLLGQCEVYKKAIANVPINPKRYRELMHVALIKGTQATTAIEGNSLTEEEIKQIIVDKKSLPPSKKYLEIEARNVYDALNELKDEIVIDGKDNLISIGLIKRFHKMIGKNLGDHLAAIPGELRNANVVVGRYKAPDNSDVPVLLEEFCKWLREEFKYGKRDQTFSEIVIQAIITHVYFEWIHPFSDGNGRTGRLLEFYILLRGGNPDIASHILSNHYNLTRAEYYRQLQKASEKRSLTEFIEYAVQGFRDGLDNVLEIIQKNQFEITWRSFIYDKFESVKSDYQSDSLSFRRKRILALEIPINKEFTLEEIPTLSVQLAGYYSSNNPERVSNVTLKRDIDELIKLELLKNNRDKYIANTHVIRSMTAKRKLDFTKENS